MNLTKPVVLYQTEHSARTRREILAVAVDIASAEGLEGLSIGRLAAELKMSKTGIFAHFGSKQQLQLSTIEAAKEIFLRQVVESSLDSARGTSRLRAMLDNWLGYVERVVFRGGCFFAAASAEFDSRPGAVRDLIVDLTRQWLVAIREEIRFAQKQKRIRASVESAQLAFELHAYVQEANWAFKLFDDQSAFTKARRAIAERIANVSVNRTPRRSAKRRRNL